jgi:acyl-CoA thioester hydrolase
MHAHAIRVYFEDTDAGGVAYHARYLHWAERARTEALRGMGLPHAEMQRIHGCFLVVKRLAVEYARPARLDDLLSVTTAVKRVGAALLLRQEVRREAEGLAALDVTLACVDAATLAPRRLPEPWLGALRAEIPIADGGHAP